MEKNKEIKIIDCFDGEYAFLSNFHPSQIRINCITYPTIEHAFQAAKTMDFDIRNEIAAASTPGIAKRMGRKVALREDWEEVKDIIMKNLIHEKFKDKELAKQLLATGDAELIEGTTWHDNYWGNCTCEKCKNIEGKNMLGKILMQEREYLKKPHVFKN